MGAANLFRHAVPEDGHLEVRSLCLMRETLARHDALADFVYAMQGLGTGSVTLFGTEAQKARFLPQVRSGDALAAFALSEPDAGSDVAAMSTSATPVRGGWELNGTKTWISNGGIAAHYVVFARTDEAPGTRGISAFIVPADTPWPDRHRTHRGDRAASAGNAPLSRAAWWVRMRCSAAPGRGSRWRWPRSTSSAPLLARPPWAWPGARWTRPCTAPARGRSGTASWRTWPSRNPRSATWRPRSMRRRC